MSYIEIADGKPQLDPDESVQLWVSPDMVVGLDDSKDPSAGWDWIADGYCVMRTSPGRHDGHPATTMTLADSDTQREVGRLVLRNDALRDARLLVTRQFETREARDAFLEQINSRPEGLPDDYVETEARTVLVGDRIFVEADPNDPDLENGTVLISKVEFHVYEGRPIVTLHHEMDSGSTFIPGEWGDYGPDAKVWVKRA